MVRFSLTVYFSYVLGYHKFKVVGRYGLGLSPLLFDQAFIIKPHNLESFFKSQFVCRLYVTNIVGNFIKKILLFIIIVMRKYSPYRPIWSVKFNKMPRRGRDGRSIEIDRYFFLLWISVSDRQNVNIKKVGNFTFLPLIIIRAELIIWYIYFFFA